MLRLLFAAVVLPIAVCWRGFCLMLCWNWFAPLPFSLVLLPCAPEEERKDAESYIASTVARQFFLPGIVTLSAFLIHWFAS